MQIKLSFTVGKSDECRETIQGFWNDFGAQDRFDPDRDALVLATLHRTANLGGLASLLRCARSSSSPGDFKNSLETSGFVSDATRRCYQEIRSIVDNMDPSGSISEEMLWRFLKTMYVQFLDFTTDTAQQEAAVTQWLALSSGDPDAGDIARDTWRELVALAADASPRAKTFRYHDLPGYMRERYGAIPVPMLQALTDHSTTILKGIRSTIGDAATLPRTEITTEADMALGDRVVALTGPPGSGKSALAKSIIERHSGDHLCLSFRATEFAKSHIDDVLPGAASGERFGLFVGAQEKVLIHVDGLEHLLECSVRNAFGDLVTMVENCPNVSLMLTCRDNETEKAIAEFFGRSSLTCLKVRVPPLDADEMEWVGREIPSLKAPLSRPELAQIMSTPYVLDMAARMDWSDRRDVPADIMAFRKKWWSEIVRNDGETADRLPGRRERTLVDLAVRRSRELRPSVPANEMDEGALDKLHKDGIVTVEDDGLAAPAHDVIEDWAVMRYVDLLAAESEWQAHAMPKDLGTSPAVRRVFREWLKEWLDANAERADRFVLSAYGDDSLPGYFRDDVLVSLLTSNSARKFIARQKDKILANNALLVRLIRLTRMACTKPPESGDGRTVPKSVLMKPDGEAWPALLEVIADGPDKLLLEYTTPILELLEDWSLGAMNSPAPTGATAAGRIAYRLLEQPDYDYKRGYNLQKRVLEIIMGVPDADESRFLDLVERASPGSERHDALSGKFGRLLVSGVNGFAACMRFPERMAQLTRSLCLLPEEDPDCSSEFYRSPSIEYEFGLRAGISFDFFPNSAFRGPFLALLKRSPDIGIQLILDLANHAGDWYGNQKGRGYVPALGPVPSITISIPGRGEARQWADDRLWLAYRGVSYAPHIIKCALMALERWLLEMCEAKGPVEPILLKMLRDSNNVMTTAVVASVCCAYPTLSGSAALVLLESLEYVRLDRRRMAEEHQSAHVAISGSDPLDRYYGDERRGSNALLHRRQDLSTLAVGLQFGDKKGQVWSIIDSHLADIPDTDRTDEDRARLLMLHGMDVRRMKHVDAAPPPDDDGEEGKGGKTILSLDTGKMDADLLRFYHAGTEESQQSDAAFSLLNRGLAQWRQNSKGEDAESWRQVLAAARGGHQQDIASDFGHMLRQGPSIVAAVCVRDHWDDMDEDDRQWCTDVLVSEIERDGDGHCLAAHTSANQAGAGHAAFVLPGILARDPENQRILKAVARAVTHGSAEVSTKAAEGVAEYLEPQHRGVMLLCTGAVAMLSNRLAQDEQQHTQGGQQAEPDKNCDTRNLLERVRGAVVDGCINVEKEIAELDIGSRYGRNAAWCIMPMLGRAHDLPLARDLFSRIGQAVVNAWAAERENRGGYADSMFWDQMAERLADIILALPPSEIKPYCRSFLDAVDKHPKELAWFVETLVRHENMASAETSFWDVWQALVGRIANASWSSGIRTSGSTGVALVDKMLFNIGWRNGPGKWPRLIGHEDKVNDFVISLPVAPPVLTSFAHYLYSVGESALPSALTVVAARLQAGSRAELLDRNAVFYLESVLRKYVYGQPRVLKTDPALREATLAILGRLVDAGSSAAYRMRDDFTTPSVD